MVVIDAVQVGIGHVDFLVLFALPCVLLFVPDCDTHFHHQFLGRTGSPCCGIDYLAMTLKAIILKFMLLFMCSHGAMCGLCVEGLTPRSNKPVVTY